jgi:hypothetical protein
MNVMGVVAAVALLVGCNDGDKPQPPSEQHVQMTKICVANGGDAAHCECQATKLDELLDASEIDPAVYKALILQAEGKDDEAEEAFMALDYDSRFKQSTLAGEAMVSCDTAEPPAGQ